MKLLLASTSPRRKDLLEEAGLLFTIQAAGGIEVSGSEWSPRETCEVNAEMKAMEVATRNPDFVVLGADTVVALDGVTYGKPRDLEEAHAMLTQFCGRTHEVLTGVCLIHYSGRKITHFVESTRVKFRPIEEVDLTAYLASINPLDKAGAYAAQDDDGRLIEEIEGYMSNVVGLPIERVLKNLETHFPEVLKNRR